MTIENPSFVIKNHKFRYLFIITGVVSILLVSLVDFFEVKRLGISREIYMVALVTIFLAINIFRYLKDYHYVNFTINNEKIILKYYSLRSFTGKRKSIEIPVSSLAKYEIINKTLGLVPSLILYQKIKGKAAKYPPLSLSALTKEQIKQITDILDGLVNTKN